MQKQHTTYTWFYQEKKNKNTFMVDMENIKGGMFKLYD